MTVAPSHRRFRFSLRTLLIFALLIGAGAALWTNWTPWPQSFSTAVSKNCGVSFTPDGQRFAYVNPDGLIEVANLFDRTTVAIKPRREGKAWLGLSPDGRILMQEVIDDCIDVWNAQTGEFLRTIPRNLGDLAWFSPDSRWLLTYLNDGERQMCHLTQADNGVPVFEYAGAPQYYYLPNNRMVIQSNEDVAVWNIMSKSKEAVLAAQVEGTSLPTMSGDGTLLLIYNRSAKSARVFDLRSCTCIATLQTDCEIESASFSADGSLIVTGSLAAARLWDCRSGKLLLTLDRFAADSMVRRVNFIKEGHGIMTDDGSSIRTWGLDGSEQFSVTTIATARKTIEGWRVLDEDGCLWDIESGRFLMRLPKIKQRLFEIQMSRDGKMLAIATGTNFRIYTRRRPEQWWGLAWLPEFWLTIVFAIAFIWSLRRDAVRK